MNRAQPKPKRNGESKSANILPEDEEIAKRYIEWKQLLNKYDNTNEGEDDGIPIEDLLELYEEADDEQYEEVDQALECSDDDNDKDCPQSDYAALQKEVAGALKERSVVWKNNGLDNLFSSDFSLSVDCVQRWLGECEHGTGRQVTQERETRFTEYDGRTQKNVTHRENISIMNERTRQQLSSEHNSNYEFCDSNQRTVIVHQLEKSTISSFITVDPRESNGTGCGTIPKLPMHSFFGNVSTFTPFKLPNNVPSQRPTTAGKGRFGRQLTEGRVINTSSFDSSSLIRLMENSLKIVPKSVVANDIKNKQLRSVPSTRRVRFKLSKNPRKRVTESSDSSDSDQSLRDSESSGNSSSPKRRSVRVTKKPQYTSNPVRRPKKKIESSSSDSWSPNSKSRTATSSTNDEKRMDTRNNQHQYLMPSNYRKMLSVNGHCPYQMEGIIIYRPKPIHQGLPRDAGNILIQTKDLDLSGIKSNLRRKKFDNFSRRLHPNSVLVYYMSDTDEDSMTTSVGRNLHDDSSDDDPILRVKPQLCVLSFFNDGT
uniref:Uncharacterized protein n=1 Tax=Anopheles minimus TaxID=112268 RepID=A0A182VUV9_9DIPT